MRIGEVAGRSGVSARMLRHNDGLGVLRPSGRTSGGYRHYTEADLRRLFHVEALRSLGMRLEDVAAVLDDPGFDPGPLLQRLHEQTQARLARDTELLRRLDQVRASGAAAWDDVLRTTALLRGLQAPDGSRRHRAALAARQVADVGTLADAVLGEPDPVVAGALRWSLVQHGDAAVAPLERALTGGGDGTSLRARRAVEALAALGTPAADRAMGGGLHHPDPQVRGRAALALGRSGEASVLPVLVGLVAAGHDDVEAAETVARLVAARAVPVGDAVDALAAVLVEADATARRRVASALAELPREATRTLLRRLAGDPDRGVSLTARSLLGDPAAPC